jgi:hypothetical protein
LARAGGFGQEVRRARKPGRPPPGSGLWLAGKAGQDGLEHRGPKASGADVNWGRMPCGAVRLKAMEARAGLLGSLHQTRGERPLLSTLPVGIGLGLGGATLRQLGLEDEEQRF